ncbi:hypothetical protein TSOC_003903 [Tetrabaena socialis]|uniref:Uncharacterized protein n=1 Tax=Tetrabaena socialis TaxID=47790 RepID=A0A2J7ZKE7_9CHLO|nr:hypothetical protein TSOC_013414 [Tetrabaena socialis]PNH09464.1 hypothetical protein TSOC_003903 [Tetrabaena socialis]|eukprot:PNH00742.1 hypothetical protein TSOC_013414 [Tetrabaena socialis]
MAPALLSTRSSICVRSSRPCAARCVARPSRYALAVRAELQDPQAPVRNVHAAMDSFLRRYDVLSTGVGALIVTGYCVYAHGQDPLTALSITFTSTVCALVANELLFTKKQ